jgi:hypothetical protein
MKYDKTAVGSRIAGVRFAAPLMAIFVVSQGCTATVAPGESESVGQSSEAVTADPVPCGAFADAVDGNTGSVTIGASTLIDSYQSSLGAYGGTNIGSAAVVQAATTITNNGGVVHGTLKQHAPGGFAAVPVPAGAKNLPLGSSSPGTLSINTAAQSITLAPGNYVAANINVSSPGAINVSPAGEVRIWVTGSLNLGGNLNLNGIPKNLAFLLPNSGFVNIGSGSLFGVVYAPTSSVFVSGPVFGSVIGSNVNVNSGGAVHFDVSSECNAPAGPALDQSFTTGNDLSDGLYGKPVLMAQTYTAGITGNLEGVAIDVTSFTTFVARIQIEALNASGAPSNVVLGTANAATSGNLSINTVIPFTTAIPQVAGQQYAILVDYPGAPMFVNNAPVAGVWNGSDGNLYTRGTLFTTFNGGTTWTSSQAEGFDLHFQTFVTPN